MGKATAVAVVVAALGYFFFWSGDSDDSAGDRPEGDQVATAAAGEHPVSPVAVKKKVIDLTIPTRAPSLAVAEPVILREKPVSSVPNQTVPERKEVTATVTSVKTPDPEPRISAATPIQPVRTAPEVEPAAKTVSPEVERPVAPPVLAVRAPVRPEKLIPDPRAISAEAEAPLPRYTGEPGSPLAKGLAMVDEGKVVEGRAYLSELLVGGGSQLSARGAETIRETLSRVNGALIFSPRVIQGDPLVAEYTVKGGDLLLRVARRFGVSYQFLEQINGISARRIRPGQRIKVVRGPFHAVVSKSDYRMDMFLVGPDQQMVYVRSFPVGLGESGSTPVGQFMARRDGKLENPSWTDPRNNRYFAPDDPMNPIGEYWIGIKGTDDATRGLSGYGIHGTVEPESIGRSASRGCVRMYADDIAMVYRMIAGGKSTVVIQP